MSLTVAFDIFVLVVLLVSAGIAFLRGFIREVLTIFGVVGGLAAAYFVGPALSPVVRGWFGVAELAEGEEPGRLFGIVPYTIVADVLAAGSVFILVVIVLSLISHMLSGWAKAVGLGAVDRTFGVIFGIVRAVIIIAIMYLPYYAWSEKKEREAALGASKSFFYVETTAGWLAALLPENMRSDLEEKAGEASGEAMAKATREKLQELDLLQGGEEKAAPESETDAAPGYEKDERSDMSDLIEDNLND